MNRLPRMRTGLKHYILDEHHNPVEVPLLTWAEWFDNNSHARCCFKTIFETGHTLHTTFMGIPLGISDDLLFETALEDPNACFDVLERYATYAQARAGHLRHVAKLFGERHRGTDSID